MSEENHYHYVTWSGGGAKGGGYGGSYTALKKSGAFDHVKTVAGSSAGAISAILAASGATPEKLQQVTESMDFQALLRDRVDGSMVTRSGTPLYEFLKAQVKENISVFFSMHHRTEHSPDIDAIIGKSQEPGACITFADLAILNKHYPKTFKRAIVTAVVKSTGKLHIFNASNDPDVDVALAAKASAALPRRFHEHIMRKIVVGFR